MFHWQKGLNGFVIKFYLALICKYNEKRGNETQQLRTFRNTRNRMTLRREVFWWDTS